MTYAPLKASDGKTWVDVIDLTDTTITLRAPDGREKTIPRPASYSPDGSPMPPPSKKPKRVAMSTHSVNIRPGMWTVTSYSDGTRKARLTETWDEPKSPDRLVTDAQRAAQDEYERARRKNMKRAGVPTTPWHSGG